MCAALKPPGGIGMAIGTWLVWLGISVGLATVLILFVADRLPEEGGDDKPE